jgi:hypothetical protein
MKKRVFLFVLLSLTLSLAACSTTPEAETPINGGTTLECGTGDLTLDQINAYLNDSADMGPGSIANVIAIVPINHIDGPRNESSFYAFVHFKYVARDYIKYQITYLSCTCRAASVNFWQTAYVELTLPESKAANDVVLRYVSFDRDPNDTYTVGFWGDSDPTPEGVTYATFKNFINYFIDKDYEYISSLDTMDDINIDDYRANGRENFSLDTFTGSSVSTNNVIRMLHAIMEYHLTDTYFE